MGGGWEVVLTMSSPSLFQWHNRSVIGAFRNRFLAVRPEKGKVMLSFKGAGSIDLLEMRVTSPLESCMVV